MKVLVNRFHCLTFTTLFILLITLPTAAHKVILYAFVEGETIIAEGGFGDGSPAKNSNIKIYDSKGQLLKETITNEKGIAEISILDLDLAEKSNLKIVLNAGLGHQADYTISEEELSDIGDKGISGDEGIEVNKIEEERLRTIISQELEKEIDPLRRRLVQIENDKRPGLTEILGGIGYIFGIMGTALYFLKGRKNSD